MGGDCWSCGACKPRYKSLVDGIFPANAADGLVKGNMDKLTYYAMRSPEKLDRIGAYLDVRFQKVRASRVKEWGLISCLFVAFEIVYYSLKLYY